MLHFLTELASWAYGAATIAVQDATTLLQSQVLNRLCCPANAPQGIDLKLAFAIASPATHPRPCCPSRLRQAAAVTVQAHTAGMASTQTASVEAEVRGRWSGDLPQHDLCLQVVTVHGEVLHNNQYHHPLQPDCCGRCRC